MSTNCLNNQPHGCPALVDETVCVQAGVTVTPSVQMGNIEVCCLDSPGIEIMKKGCKCDSDTCSFLVTQNINVKIPVSFRIDASAECEGIICGPMENPSCHKAKNCQIFYW